MRVRTRSACVVLALGIITLVIMTAAGSFGTLRPAQANNRIASITGSRNVSSSTTRTSTGKATEALDATSAAPGAPAARPGALASPDRRPAAKIYLVRPGDTLSGIAAAFGVLGGWQALYAANRQVIGPDPGLIHPGAALTLPGRPAPARYTVTAGDTLSGIAEAFGVPGGWPALYAANRRAVGPHPGLIHAGITLAIPRPTPANGRTPTTAKPAAHPAPRPKPAATPAPTPTKKSAKAPGQASATAAIPARTPAVGNRRRSPRAVHVPALAGLPRWLEIVLLAAGLLIATAFLTEPTLAIARRRRARRSSGAKTRIVLADYDRLVVTHSGADGTVCVLRPPGAHPEDILLAARLVLAQDRYEELAGHLGVPAHWPRE